MSRSKPIIELWAHRNTVLDQVEGFLWNDILRYQFTFHTIGTIAYDPISLILFESQEEDHVVGRNLVDIQRR